MKKYPLINPFTGESIVDNVFCPTGKGGGVDATCPLRGRKSKGTLTPAEKGAIDAWTGIRYKDVRNCQSKKVGCNEKTKDLIKNLKSAVNKLPQIRRAGMEGFGI